MRVVIIDDDSFVTTSLKTILGAEEDVQVAGVGNDGSQALALYEQHQPDILLMDIQMTELSGLDAAKDVLARHPSARVVFLTTFADEEYLVRALQMGAKGYLIKQEVASIAPALRSVLAGQSVLGSEVLGHIESLMSGSLQARLAEQSEQPAQSSAPGKLGELSEREHEIMELVARGLDNKEIAGTLYISEGTVRNHISTILTKLNLKNRTQLAILYYQA